MPGPGKKDDKKKKKKKEEVKIPKDLAEQFDPVYLRTAINLFDAKDKKNDGLVDLKELDLMLRLLGGNPTDGEVEQWRDTHRLENKKMDLLGFLDCAAQELRTHKTEADILIAFQQFDEKENGLVKDAALRDSLATKCEPFPAKVVDEFFDEANDNRNETGEIKYGDFIEKMTGDAQKAWNKKAKKMGVLEGAGGKGKKGKGKKKKKK